MYYHRHLLGLLGLWLLGAAPLTAAVAIIQTGNVVTELERSRVRDLFLGRVCTWADGTPVTLILVADPTADVALSAVVGRDRQRLLRGWKRLTFSGAGVMPQTAPSLAEAAAMVARTPGAIALAPAAVEVEGVRSLTLVDGLADGPAAPPPAPPATAPQLRERGSDGGPDAQLPWVPSTDGAAQSQACHSDSIARQAGPRRT
jgi:hypothetical protein